MLRYRVLSSLAIMPLVFAAVWFGRFGFIALVAVATVAASLELYRLTAWGRRYLTLGQGLALVLIILSPDFPRWLTILMPWAFVPGFVFLEVLGVGKRRGRVRGWGWALTGALFLGGLLGLWIALRQVPQGRDWVLLGIGATFACDTAAYFVGRAWGRHKLAPTVSPRKTKEGAVAGFLGAIAGVFIVTFLSQRFAAQPLPMSAIETGVLGALIGVFAQLGDLAESWLKRRSGVKDSGSLIPGHGGMLDRLDSIVFVGMVLYYYVIWVVR
ncbi:MAG: phosphatidate cytidylyltransferase [Chloroflexi bacterium]|nr:phosphatidate cytidylyltransferase [Chloroflexota bacterium]